MPCDYIVVGAGSAGCVVARGLAEQGFSVWMLEAGPPNASPSIRRPACYPRLFGTPLDWGYRTQRQTQLNGRALLQPRGRGPGGCTLINAMIWMPPRQIDRQRFAVAGGPLWSGEAVAASVAHVESWVRPQRPADLSPSSQHFLAAASDLVEAFPHLRMVHRGRRRTSYDVLQESSAAERVTLLHGVVDRLEVADQRVVGVRFQSDGSRSETLTAGRGVILCAGTFQSPAILMRSGIGPQNVLRQCAVECIHPLPAVGKQLVDHLVMPVVFATRARQPFRYPDALRELARWQHLGSGPLASNLAEAGGFGSVTVPTRESPASIQFHVTPTDYLRYPATTETASMTIAVTDSLPRSRGQLAIVSQDPSVPPWIDPGYLSDASDLEAMVAGVRLAREITQRAPLSDWCIEETLPGSKRSDHESLARCIRRFAQTLYHPVGTCGLGMTSESVVDPRLRLQGFDACWIVDASALPLLPVANPNATVMAMAHRFSTQLVS